MGRQRGYCTTLSNMRCIKCQIRLDEEHMRDGCVVFRVGVAACVWK